MSTLPSYNTGLIGENDFFPFSRSSRGKFLRIAPGDRPLLCYSMPDNPDFGSCCGEGDGEGLKESDLGLTFGGGVIKFDILELIGLK